MTGTRRMLIEDIELMIRARRRLLAHAARAGEQGHELSEELRQTAAYLQQDTRLEQPIFVEMEIDAAFDRAITAALHFEKTQLPKDPPPLEVPSEEIPLWLEGRLDAVQRVIDRIASVN